ncbi:unnamed protein product, partial [Heterosigma akashiwo]
TLEKGIGRGTARMWLHHLGCTFKGQGKDVYYDGHERDDVVKYRKEFLARLKKYQDDTDTVVVYQDEVVYRSHECQNMYWHLPEDASNGEPVNVVLKSQRRREGFDVERLFRGKGRKGYWTAEHVVNQVGEIIDVLQFKFPGKKFVFLFDWSSNHDKKAEDAVQLHKMGVKWGGKQAAMRSTTGLKQVLYERGLWQRGMVKVDHDRHWRSMHHCLGRCLDFQQRVKSILEEMVLELGHAVDFLPKFHCELNPIERSWSRSKYYVSNFCDETFSSMKRLIDESFREQNMPLELIQKYFDHADRYAKKYREGCSILQAQMSIKKKSHRATPASEAK